MWPGTRSIAYWSLPLWNIRPICGWPDASIVLISLSYTLMFFSFLSVDLSSIWSFFTTTEIDLSGMLFSKKINDGWMLSVSMFWTLKRVSELLTVSRMSLSGFLTLRSFGTSYRLRYTFYSTRLLCSLTTLSLPWLSR